MTRDEYADDELDPARGLNPREGLALEQHLRSREPRPYEALGEGVSYEELAAERWPK